MEVDVEIEVKRDPKFEVLYDLPPGTDTIICIGGRGGMKTYELSKFIAYSATILKKRCVILRDEKALIKDSILNEVWTRYDTANADGLLNGHFIKNDTELKDKQTGNVLVYTKGFRASTNDKRANLKGASNIDIAVIEEGEDINDPDKFNTFVDSLRKKGCLVIIILNTPDTGHFILKRYFTPETTEHEGYFRMLPKKIKGFVCIQTSFEDNSHLEQNIIDRYRSYGDPESPMYNLHYYLTAILGYSSAGRKGQVLKKVRPIKREDYLSLPFKEYYGQDFGTSSPAGLVGVKFDKNNCFARAINYKPMGSLEIGKLYCRLGFGPTDRIVADCADAKAIKKLKNGFEPSELSDEDIRKYPQLTRGFHVVPCVKGTDSVTNGVSLMENMNLYIVEEDAEFWEEITKYVYAQDKYGNYTNDPIDDFNHLIDPLRYVVNDQRGKTEIYGY